jgi:drug/metabolite transporter (DMT)-like permease
VALLAGAGVLLGEPVSWVGLWRAAPDLLFVGVLSSALMFTLFSAAMRVVPATETAVIASLEALFAAAAAWVLLGERLSALGWVGAVLMIVATLVVHLPGKRSTAALR